MQRKEIMDLAYYPLMYLMSKRNPLIYEISGKFYFMGSGVFRECTEEEAELYKRLMAELQYLRDTYNDLSQLCTNNVQKLSALFTEIMDIYKWEDTSAQKNDSRKRMAEFFYQQGESAIEALKTQIIQYITIMNLDDGAFYREDPIYEK